jgi:hypothetical protein
VGSTIGSGYAVNAEILGVISPKRESIGSEMRSGTSGCPRILRALSAAVGSRVDDLISILLDYSVRGWYHDIVPRYVSGGPDLGRPGPEGPGVQPPPPLTVPVPLPLGPLPLELPDPEPEPEPELECVLLEPLLEPDPPPVCDPDPWEGVGAGGASACDAPPDDSPLEP